MERIAKLILELGPEELKKIISESIKEQFLEGGRREKRNIKFPKYLTRNQASEILGIHLNTLRNWEKQGIVVKEDNTGVECYCTNKILKLYQDKINLVL